MTRSLLQPEQVREAAAAGLSLAIASQRMGVAHSTLREFARRHGIKFPDGRQPQLRRPQKPRADRPDDETLDPGGPHSHPPIGPLLPHLRAQLKTLPAEEARFLTEEHRQAWEKLHR